MNVALIQDWIDRNQPNGSTKLAAAAGISPGTLYNIMNREDYTPSLGVARALAEVLKVSLDDLAHKGSPPAA